MLHSLVKEVLFAHLEKLSGLASLYRQNAPFWLPLAERWRAAPSISWPRSKRPAARQS